MISHGCASLEDKDALNDLLQRHPQSCLPESSATTPPALTVDTSAIMSSLRAFPRGLSPGFSKLRAQHLLDATMGTIAPSSQTCLENLTKLVNSRLSGKLDKRISPWLVGAPLTALQKKSGGFRPIAVGEVLRRLTSHVCCSAVKPHLSKVFLPYDQVGVGTKGGLEPAVHTARTFIQDHGQDENFAV